MSNSGNINTILAILKQCADTTILIGKTEGHFLSDKQLSTLNRCVATLEIENRFETDTPEDTEVLELSSEEDITRNRRLEVSKQLKTTLLLLTHATPEQKVELNLVQGKLLSERAKLDKLIKQFDSL